MRVNWGALKEAHAAGGLFLCLSFPLPVWYSVLDMKPKIGISMNYCVTEDGTERAYLDAGYFEYVAQAGAMPFPIPPVEDVVLLEGLLNQLNGILFTGGLDLDPALWQEPQRRETRLLHPRRQRFCSENCFYFHR